MQDIKNESRGTVLSDSFLWDESVRTVPRDSQKGVRRNKTMFLHTLFFFYYVQSVIVSSDRAAHWSQPPE